MMQNGWESLQCQPNIENFHCRLFVTSCNVCGFNNAITKIGHTLMVMATILTCFANPFTFCCQQNILDLARFLALGHLLRYLQVVTHRMTVAWELNIAPFMHCIISTDRLFTGCQALRHIVHWIGVYDLSLRITLPNFFDSVHEIYHSVP